MPKGEPASPGDSGGNSILDSIVQRLPNDILSKIFWLFLLLPGFLSYSFASLIAPSEVESDFKVVASSFTYLLINLIITAIVFVCIPRFWYRMSQPHKNVIISTVFITVLLVISLITGFASGVMQERDTYFTIMGYVPFLPNPIQDSSQSPLDRILRQNQSGLQNYKDPPADARKFKSDRATESAQAWARVTTSSGVTYEGWPYYFDARRSQEQIYLSPACRLIDSKDGITVLPISGPGVVVFERDIRNIVLLDIYATRCSSYWNTAPEVRAKILEIRKLTLFGREIDNPKEVRKKMQDFYKKKDSQDINSFFLCVMS